MRSALHSPRIPRLWHRLHESCNLAGLASPQGRDKGSRSGGGGGMGGVGGGGWGGGVGAVGGVANVSGGKEGFLVGNSDRFGRRRGDLGRQALIYA